VRHGLLDEPERELLGYSPTESLFNDLKNERVHGMRCTLRFEAIGDVFAIRSHRHSTLGHNSPTQFMDDWITTQHESKTAA
jgi:hypothetical protein